MSLLLITNGLLLDTQSEINSNFMIGSYANRAKSFLFFYLNDEIFMFVPSGFFVFLFLFLPDGPLRSYSFKK